MKKMMWWPVNTAARYSQISEIGNRAVQTILAVQEVRFFFFRFLIISCKKFYRKKPVEFLITVYFFEKSDLSSLKSSLLKAGLYCK